MADLDLLSSHDLGHVEVTTENGSQEEDVKVLVWHKIQSSGYRPGAREVF
jgi:hypothetical protein